jgi:hypothetical protein
MVLIAALGASTSVRFAMATIAGARKRLEAENQARRIDDRKRALTCGLAVTVVA